MAEILTGFSEKELLTGDAWEWIHPEHKPLVKERGRKRQLGEQLPNRYEVKYRAKDGRDGWVDFTAGLVEYRGTPAGLAMAFDVTERKRAEDALAAEKAQSDLYVDLMGHDINNMNQIALGYLELIAANPDLDPHLRKLSMTALRAIRDSSRLIGNVRKLRGLRNGNYKTEVYDLGALVEEAAEQFMHLPDKYANITCRVVRGHRVQANELLRDVFINLIGNALKHSIGPVFVNVRMTPEVGMDSREYCAVSIDDNGPGVPDDMKEKIFHRLRRGETKAKGSGLGLYLVKTLVESYGGQAWVEDRVKGDHTKGARFVVMLPVIK